MALYPADLGMNTTYMAIILAMATLIAVVAGIVLVWSTKHPEEGDKHSLAKHEKYWVGLILIIFLAFLFSTTGMLPYPYAHSNVTPTMTIDVQAAQFSWCISSPPNWGQQCQTAYQIPVGNTVLFQVRSIDVTHGFGVYDSQGAILFQVQAMPGFNNSILYHFTTPGTYYVRCLEFCGFGHYGMLSQLNVTAAST